MAMYSFAKCARCGVPCRFKYCDGCRIVCTLHGRWKCKQCYKEVKRYGKRI